MTEALITLYKTLLFNVPNTTPALKTYAIVDSIRDEKVKEKILFSGLNTIDLWHEELFENEQDVPLYLIELEKDNELLDYLLNNHKKSIATYFISPYSLETLQSYYSTFTHVNIEIEENNFEKGIFGFYDPNILANYIQTLYTEEKVDAFFAGVAMWLSPSVEKEDELYIVFRDKEGEVDDVNLQLAQFIKENATMLHFDDVAFPDISYLQAHEVYIDQKQIAMFDEMEKRKFVDDIFEEYKKEGHTFYYPEAFNKQRALGLFDEAKSIGISSEAGIYLYILLTLLYIEPLQNFKIYQEIKSAEHIEYKIVLMEDEIERIITNARIKNGS